MKKFLFILNEAGFTLYIVAASGVALFLMVGDAVWKTVTIAIPNRKKIRPKIQTAPTENCFLQQNNLLADDDYGKNFGDEPIKEISL